MPQPGTRYAARCAALWALLLLPGIAGDAYATGPATPAYTPAAGCPAEPQGLVEDVLRRRPNEAGYPVCVDHVRVLDAALGEAADAGKVVVAIFGAPWCPQCKALMADLAMIRAEPRGAAVLREVVIVHLSTSALFGGKRVPVPSGEAALARFTGHPGAEPVRAIPYVVVAALDRSRVVGRNLASLTSGHEGPQRTALTAALARAIGHVTIGTPPPPAATWLERALRRIGLG